MVGGCFPYAELFKDIFPVALGDPSGGGDVPQRYSDHAVHVGEGQVHLLLGEEVHAFVLGEYPSQIAVVVLQVRLLPGRVRGAVEALRPDAIAINASLDGPGIRELRPVVRQEDREGASEHLKAEQPLKSMTDWDVLASRREADMAAHTSNCGVSSGCISSCSWDGRTARTGISCCTRCG